MNGGLTECITCGGDPCCCKEIKQEKQQQRIKDGKVVIERLWQAMVNLSRWRMRIVKWIWPDFIHVAKDMLDYYWQ